MNWGDVPAWAAFVLAALAAVISWKARNDGKRSADAAQLSATAAAESLALQREEAEERRRAAAPRAQVVLERVKGSRHRLRNIGELPATNVTVQNADELIRPRDVPSGDTLAPGESTEFLLVGSMQKALPSQLWVKWDGQDEPAALTVPPVE